MSEPRAESQPLAPLPRLALAPVARARQRHDRDRRPRRRSAIVMTLFIFTQQKASLPSWAPVRRRRIRPHHRRIRQPRRRSRPARARRSMIAGIQVGKITSVDLEDGHAVVGMDIEPKYMELIHPDATLLMRPKTNLNDMAVEVDPGQRQGPHRRRLQHPALADRTEHQPRRLPRHPRRRHPPVPPAARRRRRPGDRRPRPPALRRLPPPAALRPTTSPTSTGPSPSAASRSPG